MTVAVIVFLYSADWVSAVTDKLLSLYSSNIATCAKQLMTTLNQCEDVMKIAKNRKAANIVFKINILSLG